MGGKERNNDSFRTQLNRKIKTGLQTKFTYVLRTKVFWTQNVLPFFPLCRCVRVYQCTDVRAILSRYWLALESEFCIKKTRRCFDIDREHWSKQHITAQCQSSSPVLAAHGHPMTMCKHRESEWAFHWQETFGEGQNSWEEEEEEAWEQGNRASRCCMNTVWATDGSMSVCRNRWRVNQKAE